MGRSYSVMEFQKTKEKKISIRHYNDRTFYGCFNNLFTAGFGSPALSLPPMPIYDSPHPNKRSRYTSDPLPAAIYVTSGNYVSTFTTPYEYPQVILLNSDDLNTHHTIMSYNHFYVREK